MSRYRFFYIFVTTILALFLLISCQVKENILPSPSYATSISFGEQTTPSPTANTPAVQFTITSTSPSPSLEPSLSPSTSPSPTQVSSFTFIVNGDTAFHAGEGEMDSPQYFRGMAESIATIPEVSFMITVGDITSPADTRWTIDRYLGESFIWFPVVGNHDLSSNDLEWLHEYKYDPNGSAEPNIVNNGPSGCEQTTYSFDDLNTHFVILNVYCDIENETRTDGAIVDYLYEWLKHDLEMTDKAHIFVFGHEPAFPQPDTSAGIIRQEGESLDKYPVTRDRFWRLLKEYGVTAYITGHTHSYSVVDIDGVWQIDTAHSMGARTQSTRSTYIAIHVEENEITYDTYRVNNYTDQYEFFESGTLIE